jgi:hypothetical protein
MFTQASVHSFDMLGHVHVSAEVRQQEGGDEPSSVVLHVNTTVEGTGETDPTEWLRDALVALLESI